MEKFEAILCFFDLDNKPKRLFVGEIIGDYDLLHFSGNISEVSNAENVLKIHDGEAGLDFINFELEAGAGDYKVELKPQKHITAFTVVSLGLSGVYYQPDYPESGERNKVMALFELKRR